MRPEDSLYTFTTHFHNIWRLCDCISPSHIWKSPHINKMGKKEESIFLFQTPSIGENKRCFKSAFYSPSWMLDLWRIQWRVERRHGGMHSERPVSHYRKPRSYLSAAEHLHRLSFPGLIYIRSCTRNLDATSRTTSVCLREDRSSPIKQKPPCHVYNTPLCSVYKSHLHSDHATV